MYVCICKGLTTDYIIRKSKQYNTSKDLIQSLDVCKKCCRCCKEVKTIFNTSKEKNIKSS